ncbi:MAG: acyl-CoA dehydrogenase family protein [Brevundimonas sp.]|uniref:acyl-CoA dehydrogenase family protein n=1 Tax=Brevundimonas sp. TaxID=1871086 RepID=UPI00260336ED|nr:acyl-CoA dehydrogenase family protein [Brevundimonas sp.]MDI6625802.1 acyl-CoA dehydrogenase family protein [Brevundimonas sp.]MDQ7812539.1 acyl-CoA dehydrogenase family protein [Brevundimonas sp.]
MTDLDTFRAETRAWLEANCPAECRGPVASDEERVWGGRNAVFPTPAHKTWLERMGARGWTAPEWPTEYGGGGLSREEAKVLGSEMRRIDAQAPLASFGVWMLGPALLAFGTEEQKQRFLPEIVRGEIRWCQGYSEPGAGSDLAAIQTRAEDKGDHWIVNGQKVWTSYADKADWIFCLVRTDPEAPKHLGISFVLFDMATPGVSTRPITLISGKSPFCETFFDDVRVEKANLVGTLNRGWDVAKALLAHERTMIGAMGEIAGGRPVGQVATGSIGLDADGRLDEPMLRARIAELEVDAAAFKLALERTGDLAKAGQAHPAIASMLKYYGSELNKRRHELLMAAGGAEALEWEGERSRDGATARDWLRTKANSIEGGTSEVQLNIIAKHLLQLPGA